MLVLSRKTNESISIGDKIEVKILEVRGDVVKLGITAPRDVPVHRSEVYNAIMRERTQYETPSQDQTQGPNYIAPEQ